LSEGPSLAREVGDYRLLVSFRWGFSWAVHQGITGVTNTVTGTLTPSLSRWERGEMHA
jgi:hypothetical protein